MDYRGIYLDPAVQHLSIGSTFRIDAAQKKQSLGERCVWDSDKTARGALNGCVCRSNSTFVSNRYAAWLQERGVPLFESEKAQWQLYKTALIPVAIGPSFVEIADNEARLLLRESGAQFLRYSSNPSAAETPWWYIVCDRHEPTKLSPKTRQNINRGNRNCSVRMIQADWLATKGHSCYQAAYRRYSNADPIREEQFRESILATVDGPFEYWGVFVDDNLAGYCQCIVGSNSVNTSVTKYHPEYLRMRTSYSLVNCMVNHYVGSKGMVLSNGNRALVHDTNYQEFLINLGFRRLFCRLNVVYRPLLGSAVKAVFPFHGLFKKLPDAGLVHAARALLFQEELRRLCAGR